MRVQLAVVLLALVSAHNRGRDSRRREPPAQIAESDPSRYGNLEQAGIAI